MMNQTSNQSLAPPKTCSAPVCKPSLLLTPADPYGCRAGHPQQVSTHHLPCCQQILRPADSEALHPGPGLSS